MLSQLRTCRTLVRLSRVTFIGRKYSTPTPKNVELQRLSADDEGIVVIGLNRAESKNAFSKLLSQQLYDALEEIRYDKDVRVVVLRSLVPGIFCAGADLKERATMTPPEVRYFLARLRNMLSTFSQLPMPVIAALDGPALGGGLEMALACDLRVASKNAKIGLTETRLGIIPGGGGTQRLPRLVGIARAKELIYTARIIDGEKALEYGIVNYAVDQNSAGDAAYQMSLKLAQEIHPNGPVGVRMAKTAIDRGYETDISTGLAIENACYEQVIPTKDRLEGLKAFKEKRKPRYTGE